MRQGHGQGFFTLNKPTQYAGYYEYGPTRAGNSIGEVMSVRIPAVLDVPLIPSSRSGSTTAIMRSYTVVCSRYTTGRKFLVTSLGI